MKKISWEYLRISDDDQSHFSITGQSKMNHSYAERNQVSVERTFTDEGYSAKDFNRPSWRQLESELRKSKDRPDYIIVWRFDRLIRNTLEGLLLIKEYQKKYGVKILSASETHIQFMDSTEYYQQMVQSLMYGELERLRISDRSKMGMWSAKKSGRFIHRAPFGYRNQRDEDDRPIITVNEVESATVQNIYADFLSGLTVAQILTKYKQHFRKGHSALERLLTNPVYAGIIKVPSYKEEIETMVPGLHDAIIPEHTFWQAYYRWNEMSRTVAFLDLTLNVNTVHTVNSNP